MKSLISALKNTNSSIYEEAARALGKIGAPAVEPLIAALEKSGLWATDISTGKIYDRRLMFEHVCMALGEIGAPAVERLNLALRDSNRVVRLCAAKALGEIGDVRAVEPLMVALKENDSIDSIAQRMTISGALVKIGAPAIEPLIAALEDDDSSMCSFVCRALGEIGAPAVERLNLALRDGNATVRLRAANVLGEIRDVRAVEPLIDALRDSNSHVRRYVAEGLGKIGDARAVEPLIATLRDSESSVRCEATKALSVIGDSRALVALIATVKDNNSSVREEAAKGLLKLADASAAEPLIAALKDDSYEVRKYSAAVLDRLGDDAITADRVIAALKDGHQSVRLWAATALDKIGNAITVEPLITAINDRDDDVCRLAAAAVVKIRRQSDIPALVSALEATERASQMTTAATFADVLWKLDWYPDKTKRAEMATRNWRLGLILGFPEAIDPAVRALFERPTELERLQIDSHPLRNAVSHSSLTLDIVNVILIASSYESFNMTFLARQTQYSVKESDAAVHKLCHLVSPITTNILHLVKSKNRATISMGDDDGSWEDSVSFPFQWAAAEKELQRRGNPPYDPRAYLKISLR